MKLSCYLSCLFINLKRNSLPHILAAAALTASVPLVFCLTSLTEPLAAQPLEMYLSLTGTLLLTPIFLPEQNAEIRDTVRMRKMSYAPYSHYRVGAAYALCGWCICASSSLCCTRSSPQHWL